MEKDRKQKLIDLGAETLTESLLEVALHSDAADNLIERLIATPKENVQRYKKKLNSLKRSRHFIDWRDSSGYARNLEILLQDLKAGVDDPLTGIKLVAAFYETDEDILGNCDDSSGHVGDIFRFDAKELFVDYASRSNDKEKIVEIILKLNYKDNYGIRDTLINCAGECLPEMVIRTMIATLQKWVDKEKDKYGKRHHQTLIESLARQIKDAKLFEKTRIASWEKLLQEIYQKQGNTDQLTELLYQKFKSYHSIETLQALLQVIGPDKRDEVIDAEVEQILESDRLRESDAEFLIAVRKINDAETYLLKRAEQLDGNHYSSLLSLAETMESEKRYLAACLMYRSLLVSILERAYTKAYPHGIRYLNKLDKLAASISDWKKFNDHTTFKEQIIQAHGRKRSFWSKYEVKK